ASVRGQLVGVPRWVYAFERNAPPSAPRQMSRRSNPRNAPSPDLAPVIVAATVVFLGTWSWVLRYDVQELRVLGMSAPLSLISETTVPGQARWRLRGLEGVRERCGPGVSPRPRGADLRLHLGRQGQLCARSGSR